MRKALLLVSLIIGLAISVHAQSAGIRFDSQVTQQGTIGSTSNAVIIPATPVIKFCNAPAIGSPCSNLATTYTDSTLSTACSTSTPIVLSGTTACVSSPDAQNNWGVWVSVGQYAYTVTIGANTFGPYYVTAGTTSPIALIATPFSATPNFAYVAGSQETSFSLQLTGNVTSSTISGAFPAGSDAQLIICQDATGGRTFSFPSSFLNVPTMSAPANTCTAGTWVYCGTVGGAACPTNQWQNTNQFTVSNANLPNPMNLTDTLTVTTTGGTIPLKLNVAGTNFLFNFASAAFPSSTFKGLFQAPGSWTFEADTGSGPSQFLLTPNGFGFVPAVGGGVFGFGTTGGEWQATADTGKLTRYNSAATAGNGQAAIRAVLNQTIEVTGNTGTLTLYTPVVSNDVYRLTIYTTVSTGVATSTIQWTASYTDITGATTTVGTSINGAVTGTKLGESFVIEAQSGVAITLATATANSPKYKFFVRLEEL